MGTYKSRRGDKLLLQKPWSKPCREKSAESIVSKARVSIGKKRIAQCNSK